MTKQKPQNNMRQAQTLTRDELRWRAGILSIGETAAMLGIKPRCFRYQLESGVLPHPSIGIGTAPRRYYSLDQVIGMRLTLQSSC